MSSQETDQAARDTADLERFGYKQELKRELGTFSSFAVAFSYISPSTGIFTLFFLGLLAVGGWLFWTWPIVAVGQFIVALNFAELSEPLPGGGLRVPVDEVPGRAHLRVVHRLDLPLRRGHHRGGGRCDGSRSRSCRCSTRCSVGA